MTEVVWAILQKNNRFLLAKRSLNDNYGGAWTFPGGKINLSDKTPEDATNRELQEEVGLIGKRFRKLGDIQLDKYRIQLFICDQWVGEPKPSCKDIIEVGWFSLSEMYSIDIKLSPFVNDSLMYIAYLTQNYNWIEADESG